MNHQTATLLLSPIERDAVLHYFRWIQEVWHTDRLDHAIPHSDLRDLEHLISRLNGLASAGDPAALMLTWAENVDLNGFLRWPVRIPPDIVQMFGDALERVLDRSSELDAVFEGQ